MNNSKIFANGAILTAIWDETKKDNLDIISLILSIYSSTQ